MAGSTALHEMVLLAMAAALLFAAAHDVAVRTVPNVVSLLVGVLGCGLNALDHDLPPALLAALLVFIACWYGWRRGWIGGGDVKLLTACVLLVPPAAVPELMLSIALAGGILALLYVSLARLTRLIPSGAASPVVPRGAGLLRRVWRAERRRIRRGLSLPYSCAIAAGTLTTIWGPFG